MGRQKRVPTPAKPTKHVPAASLSGICQAADGKPSWRFTAICRDGPWSWGDDPTDNILAFLGWAKHYESMTWPEIYKGGQAGKCMKVETLPKDTKNELERTGHDDVDEVVELRPSGKPRVLGVRHRDSLLLVWWDPKHTFYPTRQQQRPTGN